MTRDALVKCVLESLAASLRSARGFCFVLLAMPQCHQHGWNALHRRDPDWKP
jgi:hypothetical protein